MEPKRSIRVPRKLWLAVALVIVLGALLLAQNSTVLVPNMDSYVVVNQRTITLKVAVAPCSWTRVTNVAETPTEVRVKVETLPCPIPLPSTAELVFRDLTVSLAGDLATRVVRDADGQAVPARSPAASASQAASPSVAPASLDAAGPIAQPEPSCACSHPPTAPPGAISKDAAIAAARRVTPGAGARTQVVWAQITPDPFARHDVPAGGTPLPESFRLVWTVRLQGGLTPPACPGDTLPVTPAAASEGPCLDTEGGVNVVLDPLTGALLGWAH